MTVLATFSAHVHDWKALRHLHAGTLLQQARELGAMRYHVFRNARNAAEVLIIVELPAYEDALEMAQILNLQLQSTLVDSILIDEATVAGFWEDMGWEEIGP